MSCIELVDKIIEAMKRVGVPAFWVSKYLQQSDAPLQNVAPRRSAKGDGEKPRGDRAEETGK